MHEQLNEYLARADTIDETDLQKAGTLLTRWQQADKRISAYIAVGNYRAATQVALGTGEGDSTPAFDQLVESLDKAINESRRHLRSNVTNARSVLSGATAGTVVLSVVAALAIGVGLWPRLSEYR